MFHLFSALYTFRHFINGRKKIIILKQYQTSSQPFEYIFPLRMSYILNVILLKDTGNEMLDKKKVTSVLTLE